MLLLLAMLFTPGSGAAGQAAPAEPPEEQSEEAQEFEPTERVPADTAISFPVDI